MFSPHLSRVFHNRSCLRYLVVFCLLLSSPWVWAQNDYKRFFDEQNIPAVRELLAGGKYDLVERLCEYAQSKGQPSPDWEVMQWQAIAAQGRIADAFEKGQKRLDSPTGQNLPALIVLYQLAGQIGKQTEATDILQRINQVALVKKRKDRSASDLVALGKAASALGADPGKVISQYFEPAKKKKSAPQFKNLVPYDVVSAYQAIGNLALGKSDFNKASKEFSAGLKLAPNHPDLRFGLAQAFYPDDQKKSLSHLNRTLQLNPVHQGALLLLAQHAIGAENYIEGETYLNRVLSINKRCPQAWAMKAALAELSSADSKTTALYRKKGLALWKKNPVVDHTIGKILTRAYRFEKGAQYQRQALTLDAHFQNATLQLADDLLRLGDEKEAWKLAAAVAEADPYNVAAYNLGLLQAEMDNFTTIETSDFTMRLPKNEAPIYGDQALFLLSEAKLVLCQKYQLELKDPILVEFFPNQQDFAIRTLGNLGGAGILGACFGSVITVNSPGGLAAQSNNWEATLWHEFCHVITLTLTNNRMPRWLSEGISVYEERQHNANWGQKMSPRYRKMILEEEALTPISHLSAAFLTAKDGEHLMFAYYESYLFVDYLIENFGQQSLLKILKDLGNGVLINDAIARHTLPMEDLELAFAKNVATLALNLGPGVDWSDPDPKEVDLNLPAAVEAYSKLHPDNFRARQIHTANLLSEKRWKEAAQSALWMIELYPEYIDADNAYEMKAAAHRALEQPKQEAAALRELVWRSAEALPAKLRLIDIDLESQQWQQVIDHSKRVLAIDPFLKPAHWSRGQAWDGLGEKEKAVASYKRLLKLKPANPAEVNYQLARSLQDSDPGQAKYRVLDALADAPRYKDARVLLLKMAKNNEK
ncbi:MAG: peptidase MA family metallohydrolase [Verrucomicrobiota bacterium]